jgi:dihydrodipicolinate synthase/N-acetylneuraminate lyase
VKQSKLPMPLRGIIPPMITPLVDRDTLDAAGLERLVEHLIQGGVHGLFILGTTGEAPSLSYRLRQELIDRVCRHVSLRVPVLVGVTDTSFVESVHLAQHAAQAGAQAVVLSAPYYFPAGQPELVEYVEDIAAELPLPVFLYNMPSHTKLTFEPDTIRKALQIANIVGLKDSSAQMIYFHKLRQLVADRPDFSLLVGPE